MNRAEYEKRKQASQAYMALIAMPEWHVIDDMLTSIATETRDIKLLDLPPEKMTMIRDMALGRLECIAMITDRMAQWIEDRDLSPDSIIEDDESSS